MLKLNGEMYRSTLLCVDSYERGVLTGRYYHPALEGGREFNSLAQFLMGADALFDATCAPQSYTSARSFARLPEPEYGPNSDMEVQEGKLATFRLKILFRQHTSWQGSVTWIDGNGEERFRSVLELIHLIDSALGGCGEGAS